MECKTLINNALCTFSHKKTLPSGYEGHLQCSGFEGHFPYNPLINGVFGPFHHYDWHNSGYEGHPFGLRRTVIRVMRACFRVRRDTPSG